MTHPLVEQLHFTRHEWLRGLEGVSEDDAIKHFGPMNCISWNIGHLAWQEQRYWLDRAQGIVIHPVLQELFAYGAPMNTPALREMMALWEEVTSSADDFLLKLSTEKLSSELLYKHKPVGQSYGSAMQRMIYHYWYHTGENQAIRQMLGQANLPEYVGDIEKEAPYKPDGV